MRRRIDWTQKELDILTEMYPEYTSEEISNIINRTKGAIGHKASKLGLKKSKEWKAKQIKRADHPIREYSFQKGFTPWNKGMKQDDFLSKEQIARSTKTRFKKGQKPWHYKPIGSERIASDGYVEVKVSEKEWALKHRLLWVEKHGEIPDNHVLCFIDGNKLNLNIDNMKLMTKAEVLKQNLNRKKQSKTLKEIYQKDRLLLKYGLKQNTKLRITNIY